MKLASPALSRSRINAVGINRAESLNQYWTAWARVTERMPPEMTVGTTNRMTKAGPSQAGRPVEADRANAAPCNCGIKYSQPENTTNMTGSRRRAREGKRRDKRYGKE